MTQHKHFELMALFLEDARVSETPWQFWQRRGIRSDTGNWIDCDYSPIWGAHSEYRRKPRTIRIGEFDVPEPMREAPKELSIYFVPTTGHGKFLCDFSNWCGDVIDKSRMSRGMCHATEEAATLHTIALISLTCTPERLAELKKLL